MAFSPSEFRSFQLETIKRINHNVSLFRFKLPGSSDVASLPVASCVMFRSNITKDGKTEEVIRPYTPTSLETAEGHVDFVIKDYPKGNMSRHVHSMKVGDTIDIKGPFQKYNWQSKPVEYVGMVAGGTGITPMLQLIRKIFGSNSPYKNTKVTLVFANQEEQDILFKEELEGYERDFPSRFKLVNVIERPSANWPGSKGFVDQGLIEKVFPHPDIEDSVIFVCGPPPFMEAVSGDKNPDKSQGPLKGILKSLGYVQDRVYKI
ncbi:hypothetical protein G6F57_001451 [Rhizopus arrhizus]|uniref:NADH-cytochrome b5 reductase n=1 Tax=Rhizopus oryzae TaxID=64495 RepID=A0A9P6XBV4_RHIOR|nr:hypothetical protein G6F24_005067 [Rhizopus arrhizus]KAG1425497.1 hypothetical protein G6F58_001889 [Rhizopus delemar]KAG0791276.1 hypothetical protein G6F21_005201 [Rhizopus arrhizus]KAG0802018.1 hypothetical protein G6F22_000672 [Rhizopus arrhizus]KAG0812560.1 hypothetical protein G6F20_006262 [Rhizopus arrhizus]